MIQILTLKLAYCAAQYQSFIDYYGLSPFKVYKTLKEAEDQYISKKGYKVGDVHPTKKEGKWEYRADKYQVVEYDTYITENEVEYLNLGFRASFIRDAQWTFEDIQELSIQSFCKKKIASY